MNCTKVSHIKPGGGFFRLAAVGCIAFAPFASSADASFVIAEQGRDSCCRIVAKDSLPSVRYAAEELRDWTEKLTGARLEISGECGSAPHVSLLLDEEMGDSFSIERTSAGAEIRGWRRGVLYGVYEVLERFGGIRWLSPRDTVSQ